MHTPEDAFNSKFMRNLRRSFPEVKDLDGCRNCWREEDAGKNPNDNICLKSPKHEDVDYSSNNGVELKFLDLKLGNICNLKCRICGSWIVSKWAKEEIDYSSRSNNAKEHSAYKWLKEGQWSWKSKTFWDNLDTLLFQIKYFEFTGGELWMIQEHFELLRRAVDKGHAENIDIPL